MKHKDLLKLTRVERANQNVGTHYKCFWENGAFVGDIEQLVDGYFNYWPGDEPRNVGYMSELFLLAIAARLKEMNKKWHAEVISLLHKEAV